MDAPITTIILIAIVASSLYAWNNADFMNKMIFHPVTIKNDNSQWYRFLSSGFVHGDYMHLGFNGYALYSFGGIVEYFLGREFGVQMGSIMYLGAFLMGVIVSSIPAYLKNQDNVYYRALGASGGVSTIIFMSIVFYPIGKIGLLFLPTSMGLNSVIFGLLYLAYSQYMAKKNVDNVGHDAHLWGAIFGLVFMAVTLPEAYARAYYMLMN